MARSRGKVALGWVLALTWLSMATATSAAPICETQTQRPLSDIVVPLGDADSPELPPTAIKLLPGDSLRFGDEPMSLSEILRGRRTRNTKKTNVSVTLGAWGGERALHLENLDRALGRDGFAPLPRVVIVGGIDADFTLGRARVGFTFGVGGQTTRQHANGKELTTRLPEWAFTAGFDVLRYQQLHVFLSTGIGVATLYVDRPAGSSVFPDVRAGEGDAVQFVALEAPVDVGAEYFVPFGRASPSEKWLLQFGVRLGWQAQLGSGSWQTAAKEGREITGPGVDLSGPRARLIFGIGAQNGW